MAVSGQSCGFCGGGVQQFISDPERLRRVREGAGLAARRHPQRNSMRWDGAGRVAGAVQCNIIDKARCAPRSSWNRSSSRESVLFGKRRALVLQHQRNRCARRAALGMLSAIWPPIQVNACAHVPGALGADQRAFWILCAPTNADAGFCQLLQYKVRKNEGMSSRALFAILDDF